ncbi:MAG: hypothetical protein AAF985_16485 [Bacteroidota bacterium]
MQRLSYFLFFFFIVFSLSAQSSASVSNSVDLDLVTLNESGNNWSFFVDDENKLYYVDFEKLSFNLSDIVVKNADGAVLFNEDVLDLPVNTIFELDFSEYDPGEYQVELRSFTGMIKKKVVLK